MKLREFANKLDISYSTALRLFKKGDIPGAFKLPTGTIVIPGSAITQLSGEQMDLTAFCVLINNLARQKLKDSDYEHVKDVMHLSSHSWSDNT